MSYLKNKKTRWLVFLLILIIVPIIYHQVSGTIAGIMQQKAMSAPKNVQTIHPTTQDVYSESESAGRIEAKYSVDVIARINGWLQKRFFDEGAMVKKGQTLFLIEQDQYQNAVNNAAAAVRQTQAALINADKELVRARELVKNDYVSKSYYDQAVATRDQAKAALDAAKAQLADARLNLSYTRIVSPIDGKIGKIIITEGNLVNTSSGPLAKIVSTTPTYVYFTLKSSEFMNFRKTDTSLGYENMDVKIQLADGNIYNEEGKIEFVDNQVDQTTGTITLRATFKNADGLLVPGDFVKVIVKAKEPKTVMLVPQTAALNDANGYYVWAVGSDNKVVRKNIVVTEDINKNWVVESGLNKDDTIVGKGIQSITREGQVVNATPLEESSEVQE
jgi:membrane fusion protein (multidrug efflux system)